jgi:hypothetical protein
MMTEDESMAEPVVQGFPAFLAETYKRGLAKLMRELREMEAVDPNNDQLREWAEELLEEFEKLAAECQELQDRTNSIRSSYTDRNLRPAWLETCRRALSAAANTNHGKEL